MFFSNFIQHTAVFLPTLYFASNLNCTHQTNWKTVGMATHPHCTPLGFVWPGYVFWNARKQRRKNVKEVVFDRNDANLEQLDPLLQPREYFRCFRGDLQNRSW